MNILINFADFETIEVATVTNKKILSLTKKNYSMYFFIPSFFTYSVVDEGVYLTCTMGDSKSLSIFNTFKNVFASFLTNTQVLIKNKLLLKGLGFRFSFDEKNKNIAFKLGYSHLINLPVPPYIKQVKTKKNIILLEASDKILLGDYLENVYRLRKSDSYKGKGFSYPYDNKKLKIIKKK